jgi:hypothetical protein
MNIQALTIASGLVETLNRAWDNEVDRASALLEVEGQARKLRSIHVGEGDMVLGMVYCLKGDEVLMRKAHQNSINYLGRNPISLGNYALSLRRRGYYAEAFSLETESFDRFHDIDAIEAIILLAETFGLDSMAQRYRDLWATLVPDENAVLVFAETLPSVRPSVAASLEHSAKEHAEVWAELAKR